MKWILKRFYKAKSNIFLFLLVYASELCWCFMEKSNRDRNKNFFIYFDGEATMLKTARRNFPSCAVRKTLKCVDETQKTFFGKLRHILFGFPTKLMLIHVACYPYQKILYNIWGSSDETYISVYLVAAWISEESFHPIEKTLIRSYYEAFVIHSFIHPWEKLHFQFLM